MTNLNYQRSYRITIGVAETHVASYVKNLGTIVGVPLQLARPPEVIPAQTIPAGDIIQLSNLPQDDADLRGLMFTFDSSRVTSTSPSKGEKTSLKLYNVNDKVLNTLNQEGCRVLVEAGYGGRVSLIYSGTVESTYPKSQGVDIVTTVILKDLGIDTKNTRISVDFDEAISVADMVESLVSVFPSASKGVLALEKWRNVFKSGGFTFQGSLVAILDKICSQYDLVYSIYNGVITVQEAQLVQGTPSYLLAERNLWKLTPDSIKTVDINMSNKDKKSGSKNTRRGVTLSTFLIPITPSQFFEVSPEIDKGLAGTYKITGISTKLDSRTASWDTILKGEPM